MLVDSVTFGKLSGVDKAVITENTSYIQVGCFILLIMVGLFLF